MEQSEPIDEQELLAYFERTALPIQRIELQLKEIERTAQEAKAKAEIGMAARQAKANAAWSAYERARGAKDRETGLQRSAEAFEKAMNAVRPPVWFAAREALIHVDLARKALQSDKRDEAVEAAMRAVNAWWRMRTRQFEKSLRYGFDLVCRNQPDFAYRKTARSRVGNFLQGAGLSPLSHHAADAVVVHDCIIHARGR